MITIESLRVTCLGWQLHETTAQEKRLLNGAGDALSLHHFALPPDIEVPLEDLDGLRKSYRSKVALAGGGLVSVDVLPLASMPAVRTILKVPQEPTGMTYLGSWTLPFQDFSFVLKVQCHEQGTTGLRDTVVLTNLRQRGEVQFGSDGRILNWFQDPYDPALEARVLRNRSDDEAFDAQFPHHPLSRVRRYLRELAEQVSLAPEAAAAAPFPRSASEGPCLESHRPPIAGVQPERAGPAPPGPPPLLARRAAGADALERGLLPQSAEGGRLPG